MIFNNNFKSPNYNLRSSEEVSSIVIHYTDMHSYKEAIELLCNPANQVSAHYIISENGEVFELVAPENRAWHAGESYWRGKENLNDTSIGIELDNKGFKDGNYHPYSDVQIDSLLNLLHHLTDRFQVRPYNIIGHSDIAPERKKDPGPLFPWPLLANNGFAIFPFLEPMQAVPKYDYCDSREDFQDLQINLNDIGYNIRTDGKFDDQAVCVLQSFFDHYNKGQWLSVNDADLTTQELLQQISILE